MATVALIIVASVLVGGLLTAVWLQQRRSSRRPFDTTEAEASSARARQDDRQGWTT